MPQVFSLMLESRNAMSTRRPLACTSAWYLSIVAVNTVRNFALIISCSILTPLFIELQMASVVVSKALQQLSMSDSPSALPPLLHLECKRSDEDCCQHDIVSTEDGAREVSTSIHWSLSIFRTCRFRLRAIRLLVSDARKWLVEQPEDLQHPCLRSSMFCWEYYCVRSIRLVALLVGARMKLEENAKPADKRDGICVEREAPSQAFTNEYCESW